ncbi:MAG: Prolipoprotein diacylglyceryl transferase, partial [uncultured Solirubrobacteraceae bacterium]
ATRDRALRPHALLVRPDGGARLHRRGLGGHAPARRARQADRLVLRSRPLRAGRRRARREAVVAGRGMGIRERRSARRTGLAGRPRLVRRAGGRCRGGLLVDAAAPAGPAHGRRPGRARARPRLCRGPDRLPAGRRRRLRRPLRPAVGDGLSRGNRSDQRGSASHAGLRDAGDGRRGRRPLAPARLPAFRGPVRVVSRAGRARALPGRVRAPQRAGAAGVEPRAVRLAGDDRRRSGVAAR